MFFVISLKIAADSQNPRRAGGNLAIIAANVFYLSAGCGPWGRGSNLYLLVRLLRLRDGDLWHLVLNMWALDLRRPGEPPLGQCLLRRMVYLGSRMLLGLFARLTMSVCWGRGGHLRRHRHRPDPHAASVLRGCLCGLFPLSFVVGLLSKPSRWWPVAAPQRPSTASPALWALAAIPLMQLFLFWWDHWNPSSLALDGHMRRGAIQH